MPSQSPVARAHSRSKAEWLAYSETCHSQSIELGLDRIKEVAARLQLLDFDCPVVTVAGTNGKGSCVELTRAILSAAAYRVAAYTSPHLLEYNERIRIGQQQVSDRELCDAYAQVERVRGDTPLTYFEFGTLAALYLFKQTSLDAMILEVGLGGRLDAVNCVDADVAVISMVDLDHMDWLGSTREAIAQEKAGIMRASRPCVFGDFSPSTAIDERAQGLGSMLYQQGRAFRYQRDRSTWMWQSQRQTLSDLPLPRLELQNAATVLQVIELLAERFDIPRTAIEAGLTQAFLSGRFQIIEKQDRRIVLDVAHNPSGGQCLAQRFAQEFCKGTVHALLGMMRDKDIQRTLMPLTQQIDHWYLTDLEIPRAATAEQLGQCLLEIAPQASCCGFSSPLEAYQAAMNKSKAGDYLLIFGSFHTVSPVLRRLELDESS